MLPTAADDPDQRPPVLLLGADVGATNCRVAVRAAAPDGTPGQLLASANGPGFNRNSSGPGGPAGLARTVLEVLTGAQQTLGARGDAPADGADRARRADRVELVAVLGVAGAGPAHHREVQDTVRDALMDRFGADGEAKNVARIAAPTAAGAAPGTRSPEIRVRREDLIVLDDQVTAFAAGIPGGTGLLLLAGTGSAAVRFENFKARARSDGMGWLLGDTGSAVWIGREVLQAAAADLDGRGEPTALTAAVLSQLGVDPEQVPDARQSLIAAVHRLSPAQWGSFAPLPQHHPGDAVAQRILQRAAAELLAKVDAVRADTTARHDEQIVLTGSVLSRNGPVRDAVHAGIEARGLRVESGTVPLDGALALAARDLRCRSRSRR